MGYSCRGELLSVETIPGSGDRKAVKIIKVLDREYGAVHSLRDYDLREFGPLGAQVDIPVFIDVFTGRRGASLSVMVGKAFAGVKAGGGASKNPLG